MTTTHEERWRALRPAFRVAYAQGAQRLAEAIGASRKAAWAWDAGRATPSGVALTAIEAALARLGNGNPVTPTPARR